MLLDCETDRDFAMNDDRADSGLWNMGHRNYAAGVLGRFISRDPIGHRGGLNLYSYPTNPISFVDADGLRPGSKYYRPRILVRGETDQVQQIIDYLIKLESKPFGKSLLDRVESRCEREAFTLEIYAHPKGSFLSTATGQNDSLIMLNLERPGNAMTTSGYQDLTHELGHVDGYLDDGPGNLANVIATENPVRLEHNLPLRLEYGRGDYERTNGGNFQNAMLDYYGILPLIKTLNSTKDRVKKGFKSICPFTNE